MTVSIRLLIDMNLSPGWVEYFAGHGVEAVHWSTVGDPTARDDVVLSWARQSGRVVFTHDLDLGTIVALSAAAGPSVLQIRTQAVLPEQSGGLVMGVLRTHAEAVSRGAIVTIDELSSRVRMLPIARAGPGV